MRTRAETAAVGALNQGHAIRMRGITLIELMTVLVIVAILSSIAVANYRQYALRSNRTDATAALLRIQVAEEKFFLQNNTYTTNVTAAPPTGLGVASPTPNGFYNLAVTGDPGPGSTNNIATSFLATATATGSQTADTSCATLTINDQGQRGSSPSASTTCWH